MQASGVICHSGIPIRAAWNCLQRGQVARAEDVRHVRQAAVVPVEQALHRSVPEWFVTIAVPVCVTAVFVMVGKDAPAQIIGYFTLSAMALARGDGKVRPSHAANDGRVFAWDDPPPTGHPGEDYGCRWAEPYVPDT